MSQVSQQLRVLAIHAHPDDVEFQCAGTLALLKRVGAAITIATMTPGDCGSAELPPEQIARVRRNEAARSAKLLGADYYCLEFRDLQIVHDNPSRKRVTELLRRVRPDVVFTAPPIDYMSDHEVTSLLVRDACFNASVPNYRSDAGDEAAQPLTKIPYLYYVDSVDGKDHFGREIRPDFIVDISEVFEFKLEMLACHESQRAWLMRQHGIDEYLDSCRRWSARRGSQIDAQYGEAFRQHVGHPYPADNILKQLLPDYVHPTR